MDTEFKNFSCLKDFKQEIRRTMIADRSRFKKDFAYIKNRIKQGKPWDKKAQSLSVNLLSSQQKFMQRESSVPVVSFPENLPISSKRDEIAKLISQNQVLILAGETGSGKTTQIPKICLALGRGVGGMIGHTQPRRIAARTVASRIAQELSSELGGSVGYQVRFTDHTRDTTHIKLMTDGVLLTEIQRDPLLLKYDTLIIDEAHERSLNIDFLLGYLKGILKKRSDLKLIVTSATIDLERFSKHFGDAPILQVSGRTYPVDIQYRPWQDEYEDLNEAIVYSIQEILTLPRGNNGDILVFLSGEREIREASNAIKRAGLKGLAVLPLYARLSLAEQNKVFLSHRGRRVVLATNVAETSITVPGIGYVIDPGTARVSRYNLRTKVQRLPIEAISQASANQRAGRCGRVSDGVCIRLYSLEDFEGRPAFTDPEILRTNLAAVILQMLQLRIGDVRDFPFVDAPDNRLISDGFKLLEELQAVDNHGKVTVLGRQLSSIPLDPRLARMLLAAAKRGCVKEMLIIATALSIQDPRERPVEKQQAADEHHRRFWHEHSDFTAYVNLWNYVEEQRQSLSQNQLRKLCKKEFLNFLRLKEWRDLHYQVSVALKALHIKEAKEAASYAEIHRALLPGLLANVGMRDEEQKSRERQRKEASKKESPRIRKASYKGTRNRIFSIFPGSSQCKRHPKWLVAAEFIETSQLFSHCVAKIDAEWVLESASHLVSNQYFEPHYDVKSGQVKAFAKISLLGLVLVEKRRVSYHKIDPLVAREVFIRGALVESGYRGKGRFYTYNQGLIKEISNLEEKSRRRDILVDDQVIYNLYEEVIPKHIVNLAGFEHWRKSVEEDNARYLYFSEDQLMLHSADAITEMQFPDQLSLDGVTFKLEYHFEPGQPDDGVSICLPVEYLHVVSSVHLEWLIPGLLRDKCIALVKGLPKRLRKQIVPVPQYVDRVLARIKPGKVSLLESLGESLSHISNVEIAIDHWDETVLDDFYRMNIKVINEHSEVIDRGRDLSTLRSRYRDHVRKTLQSAGETVERSGLKTWDFDMLEEHVYLDKGSVKVKAFPALIDKKEHVDLRVYDDPFDAAMQNRRGITKLAMLESAQTLKYLNKNVLKGKDLALSVINIGSRENVIYDFLMAVTAQACFVGGPAELDQVKSQVEFRACVEYGKPRLVEIAQTYEQILIDCFSLMVEIKKKMKANKNALAMAFTFSDINQQLARMFCKGFLFSVPYEWLREYPRYLNAILVRIEKAPGSIQKDKLAINALDSLWQSHDARLSTEGEAKFALNCEWQYYRWMIEELRVSLFAQTLKTKMPVSEKRVKKQWQLSMG